VAFPASISNQSIKRDVLVKLEHAMDVTDTLVLDTGLTYTVSYPFDATRVEENGVSKSFTLVNNVLTVTLTAAPSETNPVVVYSYVYLTGNDYKYLDKDDPTGAISNAVEWSPRVSIVPSFSQNIKNIIEGTLTIRTTSMICLNQDDFFDDYLVSNGSFFNNPIEVWYGYDEQYTKIFSARITSISQKNKNITFRIKDVFKDLLQSAYLGDTSKYAVANNNDWTDVHEEQEGSPIPFYFGPVTTYTKAPITPANDANEISYTSTRKYISTEVNDGWKQQTLLLGRCRSIVTPTLPHSISAQTTITDWNGATSVTRFTLSQDDIYFYGISMFVTVEYPASTFTDYRIGTIDFENGYIFLKTTIGGTAISIEPTNYVMLRSGDYILTDSEYVLSTQTTTNGSKLPVVIGISVPSNYSFANELGAGYVVSGREDAHGDTLKFMLEKSGIAIDSTSFTQADSDLDATLLFSIPNQGENKYGSLLKYINQVTRSTFGYVYANADGEVVYKLVKAIGTPTIIIDETDILENSLSITEDYEDIYTGYNVINSHGTNIFRRQEQSNSTQSEVLNSISRVYEEDTVLFTGIDTVMNKKLDVLKNKRITYKFSTSLKYSDINIGDEITLTSDDVVNGSVDLMVIGYTKSLDNIKIEAMEVPL
jgi:hypothetical protein